jgi:hypothetical protein
MGLLTKYQIEPIYLPQNVITYIYLHSVYITFFNIKISAFFLGLEVAIDAGKT